MLKDRKAVHIFDQIEWAPVVVSIPRDDGTDRKDEIYSEYCEDKRCPLLTYIHKEYSKDIKQHRGHTPFRP